MSDQLASWSNWSESKISVAAPGTNILTTQIGGGYRSVSGTSAAAPLVTGVAGLLKTANWPANPHFVAKAISEGARQSTSLLGKVSSGGVVNAAGALESLRGSFTSPTLFPTPGYGSGGQGPGGSFDAIPPAADRNAPPGFINQDEERNWRLPEPEAPTFINANVMPICDTTCGGELPPDGGGSSDPYFATARMRPENRVGGPRSRPGGANENLGSRNFNWGTPLVSRAGRAGLDLNIALFYNSLVWTKQGTSIAYNTDHGFPGPGFRLGFPILQALYVNQDSGVNAYLMITASGGRVEMRQTGVIGTYQSADGSYTRLVESGSNRIVKTTDGTQFKFVFFSSLNEYRCTEIKDRHGNYLTINFGAINGNASLGRPTSVVDTLGRTINFNYDGQNYLTSITQSWRRETLSGAVNETHTWATFGYGTLTLQPNFPGLTVIATTGQAIPVLTRVGLADGSFYQFNYQTGWGMVNSIEHRTPNRLLSYSSYNIPGTGTAHADCPRFTERRDWAQFWNGDVDAAPAANEEAVTSFSVATDSSWTRMIFPDGTMFKQLFSTATNWQRGLPTGSEHWTANEGAGGVKKKWSTTTWTQDNTSLNYQQNPRPTETNVYDSEGNRRRTTINYAATTVNSCLYNLPETVREYNQSGTTVLRRTVTSYRWDTAYTDRHIIGLVSMQSVYGGDTEASLVSKVDYHYDWASQFSGQAPSVQHDPAYSVSFTAGRGALVGVRRYDVTAPTDTTKATWPEVFGYDPAGSTLWVQKGTGTNHRTNFSYADSFSDGLNTRGTLAYPTTITDADGYQSTAQYNFDMGTMTRTQDPKGAVQTILYDAAARTSRVTVPFNGAYKRWEYDVDNGHTRTYSTVNTATDQAYSNTIVDGLGQVRLFVANHPGSVGTYLAVQTIYNNMGRVTQQSNPTEITAGGVPTGDDSAYRYTAQAYDWQGRPTIKTNTDGSTTELSYGGCGCAGGDVTTVRDERGRRKRYSRDSLGRLWKVEELNWDQSVYATTTNSYNTRDQLTQINQAGQIRTLQYDGHGRLWKRTTPEQGTTEYNYSNDDVLNWMKDARLVKTTFGYNNRLLVNAISYDLSGVLAGQNVASTANATFNYDAAGNRISMTDGLGSVSYAYNTLSQLTSETRTFTGVGSYTLTYGGYNLAGELTSITNPWGARVGYTYDNAGRPTNISGSGYGGVVELCQQFRLPGLWAEANELRKRAHAFAAI